MEVKRGVAWRREWGGRSDGWDEGLVLLCVGRVQLSSCNLVIFFLVRGFERDKHCCGIALESTVPKAYCITRYRFGTCMDYTGSTDREEQGRGVD